MSSPTVGHSPTIQSGQLANSELHINLDAKLYHADIAVQSCSLLKPILISPAHYQAQFFCDDTSTRSKDFGTLIHTMVLEPATFSQNYAVFPGKKDARDADYKAFVAANIGRTVIDDLSLRTARALSERILARAVRGRPFGDYLKEGIPEATIYYDDPATGTRCRVRTDLLHPEIIFDLKTTAYADRTAWSRHAVSLHYDMQAYMYSLAVSLLYGLNAPRPFVFIAGENESPYTVNAFTAGSTWIENGGRKYRDALSAYAACSAVEHWPGLDSEDVVEVEHWQASSTTPSWRQSLQRP